MFRLMTKTTMNKDDRIVKVKETTTDKTKLLDRMHKEGGTNRRKDDSIYRHSRKL